LTYVDHDGSAAQTALVLPQPAVGVEDPRRSAQDDLNTATHSSDSAAEKHRHASPTRRKKGGNITPTGRKIPSSPQELQEMEGTVSNEQQEEEGGQEEQEEQGKQNLKEEANQAGVDAEMEAVVGSQKNPTVLVKAPQVPGRVSDADSDRTGPAVWARHPVLLSLHGTCVLISASIVEWIATQYCLLARILIHHS